MGRVWLLLLPLVVMDPAPGSAYSGEEDAKEVIGALGGSANFQLKISESFTFITWLKKEANGDTSNMALLDPAEKPCKFTVLFPPFERRLNASGDCRGLQVRDLRRGDYGRYTAQIQLVGGKEPLREAFELKVYKRLSEADLAVHCHKTGNGSRQLNCSTGEEEDATVSWAEASQVEPWGKFALLALSGDEEDLNVTCQARNPIGEASRRVSVEETCEGVHGVQVSSPLLAVTVALLVLTKASAEPAVWANVPASKRVIPAEQLQVARALLEKLVSPRRISVNEERTERIMNARVASQKAVGRSGSETPQLFTVLPEKRTATVGGAMMGSTHIYDMTTVMSRKGPVPEIQGVEVALAPEELELDPMAMTQKYEEHVREQQAQVEKEDFSDMVAEHAAKQK
ncbi:hypothetical protein JRQ81_009613, partial [Phrynocephalus forsythii]